MSVHTQLYDGVPAFFVEIVLVHAFNDLVHSALYQHRFINASQGKEADEAYSSYIHQRLHNMGEQCWDV